MGIILGLTWVGGEQGAALAVDDLLDNGHVLGERRGPHTEAGHHGIQGVNSSHHAEAGIKLCVSRRDIWREDNTNTVRFKRR